MGRWPRPDLLAPWPYISGTGRYDLPGREARVLYLAENSVTAYLECADLRALRPNLALLARLREMRKTYGAEDPDITADVLAHAGVIGAEWFEKHGLAIVTLVASQKFLDLRDTAKLEQLRILLAPWLQANGFADLQSRDLLGDIDHDDPTTIPMTQHISALAYASGFAGIAYLSRPHTTETCWALYEGTTLEPEATILPITPADPALQEACAIYTLRPAEDAAARVALRTRHVVDTGGIVRGVETESIESPR